MSEPEPEPSSTTRHVAVLAFPFGTHAAPLLTLTRRLSAADPSLTFSFLSTSLSLSSLSFPLYNDVIAPFAILDNDDDDENRSEGVFDPHAAMGRFLGAAKAGFREGMRRAERERGVRVCCLLTDAFLWFAGDLAEEMHAAWVPFWTAAACSLSVHLNTDLIRTAFDANNGTEKAKQTLSFLPGLSNVHVEYLPDGVLHGNFESPIAIMLHKMGQNLQKATAIAVNSFEQLEPETTKDLKSKLKKILHVGPSLLPSNSNSDVNGCLSWLDTRTSSSVAYISFGTVASPPPNELLALAEALQENKTPFLWSIRDHFLGLFPKGFFEEIKDFGKIVSWAPQVEVLAHSSVGVFVTHCGWNSTSESITGGVPIICRPFFGDQNLNSFMVQDNWKIGVRVENGVFSKSGAIKALELVLSNEEGEKMRANIRIIRDKAMEAIGPNGTSTLNFENVVEVIRNKV